MFSHSRQIDAIEQTVTGRICASVRVRLFESRTDRNQHGFTLIELIMVMAIVGILAVFVAPRFIGTSVFQSRGFADQVQAALRYAQKEAIAQHQYVCAAFTSNSVTLTDRCDRRMRYAVDLADRGAVHGQRACRNHFYRSSDRFQFQRAGSTHPEYKQTISINGASNSIIVEAETGYVHSP